MKFLWKTKQNDPLLGGDVKYGLEKEPITSSGVEDNKEELNEKKEKEKKIEREKGEERSKMALELLDEKVQSRMIEGLNLEKSAEQQSEAVHLFNFSLLHEVIPQLREAGLDEKTLQNAVDNPLELERAVLEAHKYPEKFTKWDITAQSSLQKLIEIGKEQESNFTASWKNEWPKILETSLPRYTEAKALRDTPPSLWEKTKEISKETHTWIKTHKVETTLIVAGVFTAGWLLKKLFGKKRQEKSPEAKKETKTEGMVAKWTKRLLAGTVGIGTVYILSKIIPFDKIKSWLADLWEDKEKIKEKEERNKFYERVAQKIGVDDAELLNIMDEYEYEKFMSFTGEITGIAKQKAREIFADSVWGNLSEIDTKWMPDGFKRFIEKRKTQPQKIKDVEIKLRAFLREHEKTIDTLYPKRTIKDVFDGLARKGVFGKEYQDKPWILNPEQVPLTVQASIDKNYSSVEQNDIKTFALQVFENEKEQKESTFGSKGLIVRLEIMARKDQSYKKKIGEVKSLYDNLEQKRLAFQQSLDKKASLQELRSRLNEIKEAEEKFHEIAVSYYAETQGRIRGLWYIPFFATRYAFLGEKERPVFKGHLRELSSIPSDTVEAAQKKLDPEKFYREKLIETQGALQGREIEKGWDVQNNAVHRGRAEGDSVWRLLDRKVKYLTAKLKLEEKKRLLKGLSPREAMAHQEELLRLESEAMKTRVSYFSNAIDKLKNDIIEHPHVNPDRKVAAMREIQREKADLRIEVVDFEGKVMKNAKTLGENSKILKDAQVIIEEYKLIVKRELSIWNSLMEKLYIFGRGEKIIEETSMLREDFNQWVRAEGKAGLTRFVKNAKGQIGVMGILLLPTLFFEYRNIKEKDPQREFLEIWSDLGPSALQLLIDVLPLSFGASDWYTVWTGKEYITKRKVKGWERGSRVVWGSLGALLDATLVIPGVNIGGAPVNGITRLARATGRMTEARKIIKMWPRIQQVAERMGGWKKFAEHLKNFKSATGKAKVGEALRMATIPATRIAAIATIGGFSYNAIYSMGEDVNEEGENLNQKLLEGITKVADVDVE